MALIGTIRKNGWILIVMMTLALGGFILMEIISNAQRNSAGDANTLGKVNGEEIKRIDFDRYQQLIYSNADANSSFQVRGQSWDFFVERILVNQEAEKLGLGIGRDELRDLEFGNNLSPLIKERYKGADGNINVNYLNSVKNAIDAGQLVDQQQYPFRSAWIEQENEIVKERLTEKITTMVTKGMYTPTWQAEMAYRENNERVDFRYVRVGYDKVKDDEAPVTDADYQAFLKDNPRMYEQTEESRVISYAVFDVRATSADTIASKEAVVKLAEGLRTSKEDSVFVTANNGTYDEAYKKKSELPKEVADSLMARSVGSIVGPYLDNGSWAVAKILDRKLIPDSVRARHILLKGNNPAFEHTLDSFQNLIQTGKARFDSVAIKISQDPGSGAKGGDLGWFAGGQMVKEFNNVCFFKGEPGKMYKVKTQFGWHLVEVTGKKFIKNETGVKAAYIKQRVEPSKATQQAIKDKAVALVQAAKTISDFNTHATQEGVSPQNSRPLKANDYSIDALGSGADAREIVRWAFDEKTKVDAVSQDVFSFRDADGGYFDSKYVVAALKSIAPKGPATVATLKATPDADLKVKNIKRAEVLKGKIKQGVDLETLATDFSTKVDTARGASMMQAGGEPRVLGTAFSLEKGAVSAPVAGNSGVYVVQLISDKPQTQVPADLTMFKKQVASSAASAVRVSLLANMKKNADIRDNRSRFY